MSELEIWKKTNVKDGSPKTCKFCHAEVWWGAIKRRWYDVGGKTLHVENCKLGQDHFRSEAMNAAEARRQS